jgi:glycine hydroxymethyltransferase
MDVIGSIIGLVLKNYEDEAKLDEARNRVQGLTSKFELYPSL